MTPIEFALWLNGASELVGDSPPSPEQWATMRSKLKEVVGRLALSKILEQAQSFQNAEEQRIKDAAERAGLLQQLKTFQSSQKAVAAAAQAVNHYGPLLGSTISSKTNY